MFTTHRDCHAADAACERAAAQQAAAMQGFYARTFIDAEFAQALALAQGQPVPLYPVDKGRAALGQFIQMQEREVRVFCERLSL